jgi:RNA polymerase sigma-70 factor (family 1)
MQERKSQIALLFKEIQRGNKCAFEELFLLYYDKLTAFASQYTRQIESAEEIASELFVKIWLRRDRLSNILNPEVYLYISIKNACLNVIKANGRRSQLFKESTENVIVEETIWNDGTSMEDKELEEILDQAVASLPDRRRIIFKLIKEDGLKSREVAKILGISVRTVESQLYKAVKTLGESISDYLGYHPQKKILQPDK